MKKEIEFREDSTLIRFVHEKDGKTKHLAKYPTSRNCRIWVHETDPGEIMDSLISYDVIPAQYFQLKYIHEIAIEIEPRHLTQTTRRHIYAFIREYVPSDLAEAIIRTLRYLFAQPANATDLCNQAVYKAAFNLDIMPED